MTEGLYYSGPRTTDFSLPNVLLKCGTERRTMISKLYGTHAKQPAVYILASQRNGTLYVGVTSELPERISVHKQDLLDGFTKRYGIHRLVHVEFFDSMEEAIAREKLLKRWRRAWKIALVEAGNPDWRDLFAEASGFVEIK